MPNIPRLDTVHDFTGKIAFSRELLYSSGNKSSLGTVLEVANNSKMSRGNQREKAREKNNKKKAAEKKKIDGDPKKRLEAQAEIMRKKQAEADARRAATGAK